MILPPHITPLGKKRPSGSARTPIYALVGNPNCGKTTLFNSMLGQIRPDAGRIELAYRSALGRGPTARERALAGEFLRALGGDAPVEGWAQLHQAIFASVDFRYLH